MPEHVKVNRNPTIDTSGGEDFSSTPKVRADDSEIVSCLLSYKDEAEAARRGGLNPRDQKWQENLDLYWNRYDFGAKASWQAKETMPEVPSFVDRFAAALKEALVATPNGFYSVSDPVDKEADLARAIKRMMDLWLSMCGRNQVGQVLPFSAVFEEQMKLGAIMACSSVVTWKGDVGHGRVAIETIDPRFVWLDHTYRNLYRIRRTELDRHELAGFIKATDRKGKPIFNHMAIEQLIRSVADEDLARRQEASGHGQEISSARTPIVLDEYIATVVGSDGNIICDRALIVLANNQYIIRGPERNPFWHGKDWLTFTPLVLAPLSVYGRSYMEDFGSVAKTFTDLTNMLLDAVHTSSLNAFAMVPSLLMNPSQVTEGISPNKIFMLEDGVNPAMFAQKLELGSLSPDGMRMWQALKSELAEAASINEVGLGQFAPHSRTSATEIAETKQSSSALIRSMAQTVETRFLDPMLDLVWKTGLQHVSIDDTAMADAAGEEMFRAMHHRRRELIKRPITFQARGISSLIHKNAQLRALIQLLQIIAQSEILMQQFLQEVDLEKFVRKLFELSDIDIDSLQVSEREQMIRDAMGPLAQQAGQGEGQQGPASGIAQSMGVARG